MTIGIVIAQHFYLTLKMQGVSMNPTYVENDTLLVQKTKNIATGDAIAYQTDDNAYIIKRVIAVPGQTVEIGDDDKIYVDGELLNSEYSYIDENNEAYAGGMSYELGEDEYFVLGDNLHHSIDSRTTGAIKKEKITGKVVYNFSDMFKK